MVDPTSDVGEVDPDDAPECVVCGDPIVNDPSHRVVTWIDDDGFAQHKHFCDQECLDEWHSRE